jgi:MFS family permease
VTLVTDVIPLKQRGEGIGYYGLSISVAMFLGPILGLNILQHFGYAFSAGFVAIALLCLFALKQQEVCQLSKGT